MTVIWEYCEASAFHLFGERSESSLGNHVIGLLKEHGALTTTELNNRLGSNRRRGLKDELDRLKDAGLVKREEIKHDGAGRTGYRWSLPGG